ncbi:RecT family recombinase [Paenibacillus terrae]|uniref:RecT family recombinase n=1 Tax=Paenibacillus terrae TaxID=159743 RepID=UPI000697EF7C|nr:RecT family recombinase [Paenibacillus terrae]
MANNRNLPTLTPEIEGAFQPAVLEVIRTSLCPTATDPEFLLFAHKAASYGLDPFKNEIFFIKYGNQARIQFAAEAYLSKAREKEGFQPPDTQMVCQNDEFRIEKNPETKELEVTIHEIGFPRGNIIGAYSIVYRNGYRPVTVIMDRSEIEHMFTGQNKDNWNKWTHDMFGKHVEQRALKKQYGLDFGDDETQQPNAVEATPPYERKDITAETNAAAAAAKQGNQPLPGGSPEQALTPVEKALADMKSKFKQLGITERDDQRAYIQEHAKPKADAPTLAELKGLLKIMDLHLAEKAAQEQANDELPV